MSRYIPDYNQLVRWTVNDVCQWLMENKFGAFVSSFREAGIDGSRFAELDDVDLTKLKCPMTKRSDLIKCIKSIKKSTQSRLTRSLKLGRLFSRKKSLPKVITGKRYSRVQNFSHRPPPSIPQPEVKKQNGRVSPVDDEGSGPDDDYGWASDFNEDDSDYENGLDKIKKGDDTRHPHNHTQRHGGIEPEDDYENYQGENEHQPQEHSHISRNTKGQATIADSLRLALQKRAVDQAEKTPARENTDSGSESDHPDYEEPEEPPPRPPVRGGPPPRGGGGRPPPPVKDTIPQRPSPASKPGKRRAPPPVEDDQLEYEVPDQVASPKPPHRGSQPVPPRMNSPRVPGKRPPMPVPQPQEEEQPVYEDPEEEEVRPTVPAPRKGARPTPRKPPPAPEPSEPEEIYEIPEVDDDDDDDSPPPVALPPRPKGVGQRKVLPPPVDDSPQELYEDPDSSATTGVAAKIQQLDKRLPPVPKGKQHPPPINRTVSEPDVPAPPPPRHQKHRPPPPVASHTKVPPRKEPSDDEDDLDQDDYVEPSEKQVPPSHRKKPPPPSMDDLPDYMAMQDKEGDSQQDYEVPDPDIPIPQFPKSKPKKEVPLPSPKQPAYPSRPPRVVREKKDPPPIPEPDDRSSGPPAVPPLRGRHQIPAPPEDKADGPPAVPSSRGRPHKGVNEGRALPPTPSESQPTDENLKSPRTSNTLHNSGKHRGSVPSRPLPTPPPSEQEDINSHPWFHDLDRPTADRELKTRGKNGTFLIRYSSKAEQPYTLMIYNEHKVYNLPIRKKGNNAFALGKYKSDEEEFSTLADLVDFFKTHTLILAASGSGQTRLRETLPK